VREIGMKLETEGFKFLSLLFGECFKGKELDTLRFKLPSNPQELEHHHL